MKRHTSSHRLGLAIIAIVTAIITCVNLSGRTSRWQQGADERLSDYLYLEALSQLQTDSLSNALELMQLSYALDSSQTVKGYQMGILEMLLGNNRQDMEMFTHGLDLMRRHIDAEPSDYYSATYYAEIIDQIGDIDESLRVWAMLDSLNPSKEEVTFKYAEALNNTRDSLNMLRAIDLYNRLEEIEGVGVGISARKIRTYYTLGDSTAIETELQRLFEASPADASNHTYASNLYEAMGDLDRAMEQINIAAAMDSTSGEILNRRADLLLSRGDTIGYSREVYRLVRNSDLPLESKIQTTMGFAREFLSDTTRQESIDNLFQALLEKHPDNLDVLDVYVPFLALSQNQEKLESTILQTLDIDPDNEERWSAIIQIFMGINQPEKAIEYGLKGLEHFDNPNIIRTFLALLYSQKEDYDKAIDIYQDILDNATDLSDESRSSLVATIGDLYHEKGDNNKAYQYYGRAIELNPANDMTLNNYAYFLCLDGKELDRAERMSAKTVRNNPEEPIYLDTYAWILYTMGDYERARDYIDTALEYLEHPTAEYYEHAAAIHEKLGDAEKAAELRQKAAEAEQQAEQQADPPED